MSQHTKIEQMEKLVEEYNAPILGYKKKIGSPLIRSFTYDLDDIPIGQDIVNYVERNGVLGKHNRITLEDIEYSIIPREAGGGVGGLFGFTLKADIGVGAAPLLKAVLQEKLGIEERELMLHEFGLKAKKFIEEESKLNNNKFLLHQEKFLSSMEMMERESVFSHEVEENVPCYRFLHDTKEFKTGEKVQSLKNLIANPDFVVIEVDWSPPGETAIELKLDKRNEMTEIIHKFCDSLVEPRVINCDETSELYLTRDWLSFNLLLEGHNPEFSSSYATHEYRDRVFTGYNISHKELVRRITSTTITNFLVTEDTMKGFSKRNAKEKREIMNKINSVKNYFLRLSYNGKKQFLDTVGRKIVAYSERLNVTSIENGKSVLLEKMPEFTQKMLDDAKQLYDKDRDSILKLASSDKFEDNSLREDLLWHSKRLEKRLNI